MQHIAKQLSPAELHITSSNLLVFTDLDGTLLDHDSYSLEAALPSLNQLKLLDIPVIFNTSKTFMEVLEIQKKLSMEQPFAVENGSAICIPLNSPLLIEGMDSLSVGKRHWKIKIFGPSYPDICQYLSVLRQKHHFRFQGFNDMNVEEVQLHTGLAKYDAQLAKQRMASEPVVWNDSQENLSIFIKKLEDHNLEVVQGGRFLHIKARFDKADAMMWLNQVYQSNFQHDFINLALGDSDNDRTMLEKADVSVVIPRKHSAALFIDHPHCTLAPHSGPHGWNQVVQQVLQSFLNGA
ncbi:HAD-IIB family hydrolase [Agarivorans sp. MS3-6]|uniref:HAD-IIB family hydrolase n=1 Tax=Agarivorans sp. TSD2052 TaxID=2937286 RepID=UPI00200D4B8A|nr:HAD-IIB family hydrolase [Agarivorans sp. TSD2052]UPW19963.1 HAD-IIB family hydrolase [Agarivorans sp. TSD2052]